MLYIYCTTEGFDILLNNRLKIGRLKDFNDPFELVFGIDEKTAYTNIKNEVGNNPKFIENLRKQLELDTQLPTENIVEKASQHNTTQLRKNLSQQRQTWNETIGIICLSKSADIIQMWAHYANNHKGIVVGFNKDTLVKDKKVLVEICYQDKMVLLPVTASKKNAKQYNAYLKKVLGTKQTYWKYEQEVRCYAELKEKDEDGNYYYDDFLPSSITELYLGLRSNKSTEEIAKLIKQKKEYNHLKVYKMDRDKNKFKLIPKELPV